MRDFYQLDKRITMLHESIPKIENLINYSSVFKNKDSIESLDVIKKKLLVLKDEFRSDIVQKRKMIFELHNNCKHEVLVSSSKGYRCPVCDACIALNNIDFDCFLVDSLEEKPFIYIYIEDILKEIARLGGHAAKVAREDIEKNLGKSVISDKNALNYQYIDETKQIETK